MTKDTVVLLAGVRAAAWPVAASAQEVRNRRRMGLRRALATSALLVVLGVSVCGCVVEPIGGWCYYHPFRCR